MCRIKTAICLSCRHPDLRFKMMIRRGYPSKEAERTDTEDCPLNRGGTCSFDTISAGTCPEDFHLDEVERLLGKRERMVRDDVKDALKLVADGELRLPCVVFPSFNLSPEWTFYGPQYSEEELFRAVSMGLALSPLSEVLICEVG